MRNLPLQPDGEGLGSEVIVKYNVKLSFWARLKIFLGIPLLIEVESPGNESVATTILVRGESSVPKITFTGPWSFNIGQIKAP